MRMMTDSDENTNTHVLDGTRSCDPSILQTQEDLS